MNKRQFIKDMVLTSIATPLGLAGIAQSFKQKENVPAIVLAKDDAFWLTIRNQYLLKPDYINLENGYYNFIPQPLLEKFIQHIREVNYQGSYYMRTVQWDNKNKIAARLAEIAGCLPEEMIITRNATESLDLVIGGFDWTAGDEAVMAVQDYGSILDMFEQTTNWREGAALNSATCQRIAKKIFESVTLSLMPVDRVNVGVARDLHH